MTVYRPRGPSYEGQVDLAAAGSTSIETVGRALVATTDPDTIAGYETALGVRRFTGFMAAHGVTDLTEVTPVLTERFINAPVRGVGRPAPSTRNGRRVIVRQLFKLARSAGHLTVSDPTLDIDVACPEDNGARPLTDAEMHQCEQAMVGVAKHGRMQTAVALAQATATNTEIALATVADLDLGAGTVSLAGTTYRNARVGQLTAWGRQTLATQTEGLTADVPLFYRGTAGAKSAASSASGSLVRALRRALLAHLDGIGPDSIRYWAGMRAYEAGGIEHARAVLGFRRLDWTAHRLGLTQTTTEAQPPEGSVR